MFWIIVNCFIIFIMLFSEVMLIMDNFKNYSFSKEEIFFGSCVITLIINIFLMTSSIYLYKQTITIGW